MFQAFRLPTPTTVLVVLVVGLGIYRGTRAAEGIHSAWPLVARVNQQPIRADEARFFLPGNARQKPLTKLREDVWRAAIQSAIDRRLVMSALARRKRAASDQDIQFELDQFNKQLDRRESSLEEYLAARQISLASYRQVIGWQLTWRRYLKEAMSEKNLERYFQKHHRDFDRTQLRVAHIFWKLPSIGSSAERQKQLAAAKRVYDEIMQAKISFADAAAKYSEAPTGPAGGDIGWISRHEPMSPAFSKTAFELELNQVSAPIITSLGVHLIRCQEIKPGKTKWQDVRPELSTAVRRYLFQWLADRERATAEIELLEE